MIDTTFFKELDRFSFMVRKRVSTAYSGSRRSILKGRGMEPVSYREYTQGDDFKTIDWKVYGRTEKLYVKEFEEEKSLTTHILLDTSKSMDFRNKFEYAAMMALGFAYLVTKDNEKFAVATFGEEINITKPKRGRKYLSLTIDLLNSTQLLGKTRFDYCMEKYASVIRSRSLVFIISDFKIRSPVSTTYLTHSTYNLSSDILRLAWPPVPNILVIVQFYFTQYTGHLQ